MYTYIVFEDDNDNTICHYGIKGMKWGVRRYQNKDGSLTELGRKRYMKTKYGMSKFAGIKYDATQNGQKIPSIGSAKYIMVTALGPDETGRRHFAPAVEFKEHRECQDYIDHPETAFASQYLKVNPEYGKKPGTIYNCTKCSAAMILAKKGYDFEAGRSDTGFSQAFSYWFQDSDMELFDDTSGAASKIVQSKKGSYGTIDIKHVGNPHSGHVVNWEHNADGTFSIYDAQAGRSVTSDTFAGCLEDYNNDVGNQFDMNAPTRVYDLTDATPIWSHLGEDSVVRFGSIENNMMYDRETKRLFSTS